MPQDEDQDLDAMLPAKRQRPSTSSEGSPARSSRRRSSFVEVAQAAVPFNPGAATGNATTAAVFADADALRDKLHENIAQKDYDVTDLYHETGCFQAFARSSKFSALTLLIIAVNAIWIGLDAECNDPQADGYIVHCPVQPADEDFWQAGEHAFCTFFTFELFIRFGAFRRKRSCCRDGWFTFDSALVFFMVVETWIVPIATGGNSDSLNNFSLLRMLRLLRLTRMVRLMRSVPELMTLLKGMVVACKSVSYTLLLLLIFMYIFAIIFKSQLTDAEDKELRYHFSGIPRSMWTLLLAGCLLDEVSGIANLLVKEGMFLAATFIFFVLLSSLMVLNMLIGVLCAVVSAVAAAEKEKTLVTYVKTRLITVLESLDEDGNGTISKKEFDELIHIPQAMSALDELGVDVPNLVSLSDHLFEGEDADEPLPWAEKVSKKFSTASKSTVSRGASFTAAVRDSRTGNMLEDEEQGPTMSFAEFLEMVIRLRSDNAPSVADIVELRKLIFKGQRQVGRRLNHIEKGQHELQRGIRMMCEQLDSALTLSLSLAQQDEDKKSIPEQGQLQTVVAK